MTHCPLETLCQPHFLSDAKFIHPKQDIEGKRETDVTNIKVSACLIDLEWWQSSGSWLQTESLTKKDQLPGMTTTCLQEILRSWVNKKKKTQTSCLFFLSCVHDKKSRSMRSLYQQLASDIPGLALSSFKIAYSNRGNKTTRFTTTTSYSRKKVEWNSWLTFFIDCVVRERKCSLDSQIS